MYGSYSRAGYSGARTVFYICSIFSAIIIRIKKDSKIHTLVYTFSPTSKKMFLRSKFI